MARRSIISPHCYLQGNPWSRRAIILQQQRLDKLHQPSVITRAGTSTCQKRDILGRSPIRSRSCHSGGLTAICETYMARLKKTRAPRHITSAIKHGFTL